jgi:membrane-associated HD superfamily phosphohydrolase
VRRKEWENALQIQLPQTEWQILEKKRFHSSVGESALKLLTPILIKGVVNDKDLLDPDAAKGVALRNFQTREEKNHFPPFTFLDFKEARTKIRSQAELLSSSLGTEMQPIVLKIAEHFLRPNLTFNKNETEERKIKAKEKVAPVYSKSNEEGILRSGERVREEHLFKIKALKKAQEKPHPFHPVRVGPDGLPHSASLYQFSTMNIRKFTLSQPKDLLLFSSTLIGTMALLKLFQLVSDFSEGIPWHSLLLLFLSLPHCHRAMVIRIVLTQRSPSSSPSSPASFQLSSWGINSLFSLRPCRKRGGSP